MSTILSGVPPVFRVGGTFDLLLTNRLQHRGWDVTSVVLSCKMWHFLLVLME